MSVTSIFRAKIIKAFYGVLLVLFSASSAMAQQGIVSGGGEGSGTGGSVSATCGQVFYSSTQGVSQGLQQPYEIFVVSSIESAQHISLSVKAYPNPTTDYLILAFDPSESRDNLPTEYLLFDISGSLLAKDLIVSSGTRVHMASYASGTYILKVVTNRKEIKTFKINKL
ncbi:MAG TPA: T9SS type A sorting domain-containing protein [Tenuifilaceae bacterium]|nr:T9SS type A sorting domain-containing protein [Tenuifilaceae bacterium]